MDKAKMQVKLQIAQFEAVAEEEAGPKSNSPERTVTVQEVCAWRKYINIYCQSEPIFSPKGKPL